MAFRRPAESPAPVNEMRPSLLGGLSSSGRSLTPSPGPDGPRTSGPKTSASTNETSGPRLSAFAGLSASMSSLVGSGGKSEELVMSEKEKKMIRDAFNLFDTDGDGSVTKEELKHVMETLFNTVLSEDELAAMVTEADEDGDGEVSFEEFESKVATMIRAAATGNAKGNGSNPNDSSGDSGQEKHWQSLSRLISHFSDDKDGKEGGEESKKEEGTTAAMKKMLSTSDKRKKMRKKQVQWNQHDAMVAHFNLRRLSLDTAGGGTDEDDIAAAVRIVEEKKSREWKHRLKRPMSPHSDFRRCWELLVLILVIFQALYIPLTVSFEIVHDYASGWWTFDLITDLMFMLDLIMTFNVAIVENNTNKLILSRKRIAKEYLTGWFWLDLAASIPFDLLLTLAATGTLKASSNESAGAGVGSATSLLKGFKLPRLLRLLKVMRIMRLVKLAKIRPEIIWTLQYSRHSNILRLTGLVLVIVVIVHYFACVFYFIMSETWLSRQDCESMVYDQYVDAFEEDDRILIDKGFEISPETLMDAITYGYPIKPCMDQNTTVGERYITSFYNSMLLVQGESIGPMTTTEKMYSVVMILVGSLMLAVIFGNVSMYIANFSANSTAYQRKMEYLFESMNHLELPQNLKKRIIMYYDVMWKEYRSLDGSIHQFIPELSKQLGTEVFLYLRTNLILSVPFLRQCSPEVVQNLVITLKTEVFLPNDYIVHKGVPGEEMYLISKGVCEVTVTDFTSESVIAKKTSKAMEHVRSAESAFGDKKPKRRKSIVDAMNSKIQHLVSKSFIDEDGEASAEVIELDANGNPVVIDKKKRKTMDKKGLLSMQKDADGLLASTKEYANADQSVRAQRRTTMSAGADAATALAATLSEVRNSDGNGDDNSGDDNSDAEDTSAGISLNKVIKQRDQAASRVGHVETSTKVSLGKGFSKRGGFAGGDIPGQLNSQSDGGEDPVSEARSDASSGSNEGGDTKSRGGGRRRSSGQVTSSKTGANATSSSASSIRDIIKTEKVVKELGEGEYFGEIALILNTTRTCNVRAKNFAELNILRRDDFENIVGKYEAERKLMEEIIMEKYKVEVPDLDAQKSNNKVNSASEQSRQLQETRDLAQDTRCVVDIMAMQIKLLTDALMEADVINEEDEEGFSYRVGDRAEVQETFKEIEAKDGTLNGANSLRRTSGGALGGGAKARKPSASGGDGRTRRSSSTISVKNADDALPALERIISPKMAPRKTSTNFATGALMQRSPSVSHHGHGPGPLGRKASARGEGMGAKKASFRRKSSARASNLTDVVEDMKEDMHTGRSSASAGKVEEERRQLKDVQSDIERAKVELSALRREKEREEQEKLEKAQAPRPTDPALLAFHREHGGSAASVTRKSFSSSDDYQEQLSIRIARNTRKTQPAFATDAEAAVREMNERGDEGGEGAGAAPGVAAGIAPGGGGGDAAQAGGGHVNFDMSKVVPQDSPDSVTNTSTPSKDDISRLLELTEIRSRQASERSVGGAAERDGESFDELVKSLDLGGE
ncbi:hypothetical protein TeGR_g329 [Tetraparma gracilis]|uniref:Calmodulin n=1 Tax=Tetraparma gracilis TaxID=2962635 RepID=A0ABQ6N202_9STRA|nr:hypothetical protein TeGR_g329 [Tetraparma gracilis]